MQQVTFGTIYLRGQLPSFVSSLSSHQKKVYFVAASIFVLLCTIILVYQTFTNRKVSFSPSVPILPPTDDMVDQERVQTFSNLRGFGATDSRSTDPCEIIPRDIVATCILPYLNLHELSLSSSVSKGWKQLLTNTPTLWRSVIYRDLAFTSKNWADLNPDIVKDVDLRQEMESLPKNVAEELKSSAFAGKKY